MSDHKPCYHCGRYASAWVDVGGKRITITAPYDVDVPGGGSWTCRRCVEQGKEQVATQGEQDEQLI